MSRTDDPTGAGCSARDEAVHWHVITAEGEIDLYTAPELRDLILAAISAGHRHLAVDLSAVTFMDSSGFSVLVSAYKRLAAAHGGLRIAGAGSAVCVAMRISALDQIMPTYPDLESVRADRRE